MAKLNEPLNQQLADLIPHFKNDPSGADWKTRLEQLNTLCDQGHFFAVASILNIFIPRVLDANWPDSVSTGGTFEISELAMRVRHWFERERIELPFTHPWTKSFIMNRPLNQSAPRITLRGVEYLIEEVKTRYSKHKVIGLPGTPGMAVVPESLDRWFAKQALTL